MRSSSFSLSSTESLSSLSMDIPSIERPDFPFNDCEIVVLDWETYYAPKYTLKSMPTSEYVRDPQFKSHGLGVLEPESGYRAWLTDDDEREYLDSKDWSRVALLCHNVYFDGFILGDHYRHVPRRYMDTRSMSRALWGVHVKHHLNDVVARCKIEERKLTEALENTYGCRDLTPDQRRILGEYCLRDVDLTWAAFVHMLDIWQFPANELFIIDYSIPSFCNPKIQVDRALAELELREEEEQKAHLLEREGVTRELLMSDELLAKEFLRRGYDPPRKWSAKQRKLIWAFSKTDQDFRDLENDPVVGGLVEARLRIKSTIVESRAARVLKHSENGRNLPIMLNYWQAHTGRWGGGDKLNPQNFPAGRRGQTQRLRNSLLAPPGYKLLCCDSSQIEPRYLAWLSDNHELLKVFAGDGDPYLWMASTLYGEEYDDPDKYHRERDLGKAVLIALGYGMGIRKFIFTAKAMFGLDLNEELATEIHGLYRASTKDTVGAWWDFMHDMIVHMLSPGQDPKEHKGMIFDRERITMSNGCHIHYPSLRYERRTGEYIYTNIRGTDIRIYAGKATENSTQGECRNVVAWQAIPIAQRYYLPLLAHDEVVALVPDEEVDEASAFMLKCMSTPPPHAPDLPVAAKLKVSQCYGKW